MARALAAAAFTYCSLGGAAHRGVAAGLRQLRAVGASDQPVVGEGRGRVATEQPGEADLRRRGVQQVPAPDDEVDALPEIIDDD